MRAPSHEWAIALNNSRAIIEGAFNDSNRSLPSMETMIINRGRGPEIAGTRITVYDVLDYLKEGWHHTAIAATLGISSAQVLAAIQYVQDHRDEVQENYQKILERCAKGNPPEIQGRLDKIHAKYQNLWANGKKSSAPENNGEGTPSGQ